jgi:hypothetical protein
MISRKTFRICTTSRAVHKALTKRSDSQQSTNIYEQMKAIAPGTLNHASKFKCVVKCTLRPIYPTPLPAMETEFRFQVISAGQKVKLSL